MRRVQQFILQLVLGIVLRWFCVPKAPGRSWALYWVLRRLRKSVVSAVRFRTLLLFAVVFCLCLDSGLRWIDSCRKSPRPKTWSDWGPYLHTTVSLHYTYIISDESQGPSISLFAHCFDGPQIEYRDCHTLQDGDRRNKPIEPLQAVPCPLKKLPGVFV